MSGYKKSILFCCVVVGLVAYSVSLYNKEQKKFTHQKLNDLPFSEFKFDRLVTIKISGKDGMKFHFKKEDMQWVLVEPLRYPADDAWLEKILGPKLTHSSERIEAKDLEKLSSKLDFANPLETIEVSTLDGASKKVSLSKYRSFDESGFVKSDEQDAYFRVSKNWYDLEKITLHAVRKKVIFQRIGEPELFFVKKMDRPQKNYFYDKKQNIWEMKRDSSEKLKAEDLSQFLRDLEKFEIFRFVAESKDSQVLKKLKLDKPLFTIGVRFKGGAKVWRMQVSQEDFNKYYGIVDENHVVFQLDPNDVVKLKGHINKF